jgi:hypothetical protein
MTDLDSISSKIFETDFEERPEDLPYSYWENFCELSFVGCGTSMVAFSYGKDQNKQEYSLYNKATSEQRKHLAEVFDYGDDFNWINMRHYPNPIGSNFSTSRKKDISSRLEKDGIILNDYTDDNIVLHSGNVIIVDYGMGVELK